MAKPINTKDGAKTKPSPRSSLGRPKTARVKDHWVSFRVTAEEHFQLLDKAERSSMSAGEYARSRAAHSGDLDQPFQRISIKRSG